LLVLLLTVGRLVKARIWRKNLLLQTIKNMKKGINFITRNLAFASVLLVAVIFCGCEETKTNYDKQPTIYSNGQMSDAKVYVIDSCEYIGKLRGWESDILTHKGNCKFCAERNKK